MIQDAPACNTDYGFINKKNGMYIGNPSLHGQDMSVPLSFRMRSISIQPVRR